MPNTRSIKTTYTKEQVFQLLFDNNIEFTGQNDVGDHTVQIYCKSGCIINWSWKRKIWLQGAMDEDVYELFGFEIK